MWRLSCALVVLSYMAVAAQPAGAQVLTLPPGVQPPSCVPPGVQITGSPGLPICEGLTGVPGPIPARSASAPCPRNASLAVEAIRARPPGGDWQDASRLLCFSATMTSTPTPGPGQGQGPLSYTSWSMSVRGGGQDLTQAYPAGTRYSVAIRLGGRLRGEMVLGSIEDPAAEFDGARIVIEGGPHSQKVSLSLAPQTCTGRIIRLDGMLTGVLTVVDIDAPRGQLDGVVVGSDAAALSPPSWNGTGFSAFISGCGDGDPATDDGRYQAFIPQRTLGAMGVGAALAPVAAELLAVVNDGKVDPDAQVAPATEAEAAPAGISLPSTQTPAGLVIDYRLSYSTHNLRVRVDRRKLRAARRCLARKLRPQVRRGRVSCKRARR